MKAPAYQWYPKDILSSERVAFLSLAEEGAYRRAMDFCWLQGSIPSDPEKLATLIGKKCTRKIAFAIIHLFIPHPTESDRLIHDKQEAQRESQRLFREEQARKGRAGGQAAVKQRSSPGLPAANPVVEQGLSNGQAHAGQALHSASASATATVTPKEGESVNTRPDLSTSNLYRTPNIPTLELVKAVFFRNGGTEGMAKKFFDSNEATGWYYKSSPITNFVTLVAGYIESWRSREDEQSEHGEKKMVL